MRPSDRLLGESNILKSMWLDTKLGPMITIGDEERIYLLEFTDRRGLERKVQRLRERKKSVIIPKRTKSICSIEKELGQYFNGTLKQFLTPLFLFGSPFQKRVWEELQKIPYGKTCSYADIAANMGNPSAFRAVANANGANQIAIVIPCHRVIHTNGELGGYGGGVARKKWLIDHERKEI